MRAVFLTPPEIQHQALKSGRGYDRESVDKLLEQVVSSYEQVWLERDQLRARVGELEDEVSNFREAERYLSDTLVTAQRAAADLRSEAEREAERLKTEALVGLRQAKTEGERELEDLRAEIEQFRSLERKLRANLRSFLERAMRQLGDGDTIQEPGGLVVALRPEAADVERRNA
jgi:cell division initiation protein